MKPNKKKIILDDSHLRVLQVTFSLLDEMLITFERWANRQEVQKTLFKEINTYSDIQCRIILDNIKAIQNSIIEISADLNLKPHEQRIVRAAKAKCELFILDNLLPLKGHDFDAYGHTSKSLSNYLKPRIEAIISNLEMISDIEERFSDAVNEEHFEHD